MEAGTNAIKRSLFWGALAFCGVFAVIVGVRLEEAALTAIVGVVCGVAASIPTSMLVVALLHRRDGKRYRQRQRHSNQPPVVVVTPQPAHQIQRNDGWPAEYALRSPEQRQFSIIDEDEVSEI
jgi:hypothetical protein